MTAGATECVGTPPEERLSVEFSRSRLIAKWPLSEESNYASGPDEPAFLALPSVEVAAC
jgi:hypothetical protein